VTVQAVLQLVGGVEEDTLFRLCDTIVDRDTAGALVHVEELGEQGQDLGRVVTDLLEHLRHLLLVQHLGHVPESLPVTDETRDKLREQANQLPEPTVLRLIDLLAVAVEDMRQGADPRLPLELALVKVTRPAADLSRESLAHRVELLEQRGIGFADSSRAELREPSSAEQSAPLVEDVAAPASPSDAPGPEIDLEQLAEAWQRSVLPAVRERSVPAAALLGEARPAALEGDTRTIEFAAGAEFHRRQAEEQKNASLLRDALYEVTGRRLAVSTTLAAQGEGDLQLVDDEPLSGDDMVSLLKDTFDAEEVEEPR
jgi:DNA polymerase-3 subunit gamma/tau